MKRLKTLLRPTWRTDARFNELYEEISNDWRDKAARLQERRWEKLKHKLV